MDKKVIISIISEQSVPNLVFIKNNMDAIYFINIVTNKMEEAEDNLIKALNISSNNEILNKFKKIKIEKDSENNIEKIIKAIDTLRNIYDDATKIYVNITCGTKVLSIALYKYFDTEYKNKRDFLYLNIDDKTSTSYYVLNKQPYQMKQHITLKEYLTSYGINIINDDREYPKYSKNWADLLIKHAIEKGQDVEVDTARESLKEFMKQKCVNKDLKEEKLREKIKNDGKVSEYIQYLHNKCGLPDINNITYKHLKYINSIYLEEYLYYQLESILYPFYNDNVKDYLKTGVQIQKNNIDRKSISEKNQDQELDILFMFNNALYYIECKTYVDSKQFTESIHKQASISQRLFGLKTTNALIILETKDNGEQLKVKEDKMKIYNINFITGNDIRENKLIPKLKAMCKIEQ